MLTRRQLLHSSLAIAGSAALERSFAQDLSFIDVRITPAGGVCTVPKSFIGLGYEMSSVARPGLFTRTNAMNVQLIRNLGGGGILRVGGIVADFTSYSDAGTEELDPKKTVITRASLLRLRGFLDVVDWKAIWSVNFGGGTIEQALTEVKAVRDILGNRLLAIEPGNEVENYGRGTKPLRKPPYTFAEYRTEYERWRSAILAVSPGLSFAAPDTAGSVEWVEQMAEGAHGDVQLLTTHYYRGGQQQASLDQLMSPDPVLAEKLERLQKVSATSGIPWRICETNSFFGGGHPGLSDTFAAALWTLDYMLLLAQSGCSGVNIETGFNQLGFLSSYSPILNDDANLCTAGASYYGMLAFAVATGANSTLFKIRSSAVPNEVSFYGLGAESEPRTVVVINRTQGQFLRVSLSDLSFHNASSIRLTAPSCQSKTGVILGGASVDATGHWAMVKSEATGSTVLVPPCSAVIVHGQP